MHASALERASLTLDEVLSDDYAATLTDGDLGRADRLLDRWRDICADGSDETFRKRLARDGLDPEAVRSRLAGVDRRPGTAEPGWVADMRAVRAELVAGAGDGAVGADEHAFGPVLAPVVAGAIRELISPGAARPGEPLSAPALADMARQLWQRLVDLCGLPLCRALIEWKAEAPAEVQAGGFRAFAAHMRERGFDRLFKTYPVLLRLMAQLRGQWVEGYGAFLDALARDRAALTEFEPALARDAPLIGVVYGLSDPHDGGKAVLMARFEGGAQLLYKPKSLATDAVVVAIVDRLRACGWSETLTTPRFLARDGYGWTAFVARSGCGDAEDVERFYRTAGVWLALFYLLGASDMHMENMIASGGDPVPVDFETIFQGLSRRPRSVTPDAEAAWLANDYLERSVLTVGLLPGHVRADDGEAIGVGGLQPLTFKVRRIVWENLNSLDMRPSVGETRSTVDSNMPSLDGAIVAIEDHRAAFLNGLRDMLAFATRPEVAKAVEALADRSLLVRRVFRPTRFYHLVVRRLTDHRAMTDSVGWSMETEFLARLFDWEGDPEEPWKLFRAERAALVALTIPIFHVSAARSVIGAGGREITNLHMRTGASVSLDRIGALTPEAIDEQVAIAATALGAPFAIPAAREAPADVFGGFDLPAALVDQIAARAFRSDRSATWLVLEMTDRDASSQLVPMGYDLYNGSVGLAVFLAAFARVRGDARAGDLARAAVAQVSRAVRMTSGARLPRLMGVGGGVGVGSIAYGLATVAELLDDPEILHAAAAAAALVSADAVAADDRFDMMAGAAGACVALLKVHALTGERRFLDMADRCARHLTASRPEGGGPWSSEIFGFRPLTGMSHGASGYAVMFSRLYRATGDAAHRAVAREMVGFETQRFDRRRGAWPDLRPAADGPDPGWPNQWCYGACGIGEARLRLVEDGTFAREELDADVDAAIRAVLSATPHSNDTLCCGVAGHANFLLEAGIRRERPDLRRAAEGRMAEIAGRWVRDGDVRWDLRGMSRSHSLGLFRGLAGIGYAALRTEAPDLPNVLVWG